MEFEEKKLEKKVSWNSKNGLMCGLAMDSEELPTINNIFGELKDKEKTPKATEYVLQFLWRDLNSIINVIGPHYSSSKSMDTDFTAARLRDTINVFEAFRFNVSTYLVMERFQYDYDAMYLFTHSPH